MKFASLVTACSFYLPDIKRVSKDILNGLMIHGSGNLWKCSWVKVAEYLVLGPLSAYRLFCKALALSPFAELSKTPLARGVELEDTLHRWSSLGIERFAI